MLKRYFFLTLYGVVKYLPTPIGDVFRWLVLKPFVGRLDTFWIHEGVTIHHPERLRIGKRSSLNEFVFINAYGGIDIGDYVAIGHRTTLVSAEHGFAGRLRAPYVQPIVGKSIRIEDGVYLGAGVIVLGGVKIGRGSVIAAGAVVTSDIPPYAVAAGVPARVLRYREEDA